VKRFHMFADEQGEIEPFEYDDGEWVKYEDVESLSDENRVMRKALEDIADGNIDDCSCCSYNTGQALLAIDSVQVGQK